MYRNFNGNCIIDRRASRNVCMRQATLSRVVFWVRPCQARVFHSALLASASVVEATDCELPRTFSYISETSRHRRDQARKFQRDLLADSFNQENTDPHVAWGNYYELCSHHGPESLSIEEHRSALRKCVPNTMEVRNMAIQRLQSGEFKVENMSFHRWEHRFQAVTRWIQNLGTTPAVEDYNFILEQFAVTGHMYGSQAVLKQLHQSGLTADYKTYGLCLQAIAHRLKLPCEEKARPRLVSDASQFCVDILRHMAEQRTQPLSVNLDLCVRILKESLDVDAFEQLLKTGYGIDLSYPDQPQTLIPGSGENPTPPSAESLMNATVVPFSTAALNTTIDMYGRRKMLSRMVSAFETLTNPAPCYNATSALYSEEEDDEPTWPNIMSNTTSSPQHATPNITSYNFIIKHSAKAGSVVLARHYTLEALAMDRRADRNLRDTIASSPIETVQSPNFSANRGTILPLFGLANRSKHLPLAQWVVKQCTRLVARKTYALQFFDDLRKTLGHDYLESLPEVGASRKDRDEVAKTSASGQSDDVDVEMLPPVPISIDPDLLSPPPPGPVWKPFNIILHISILRRDISELQSLLTQAEESESRLSQRIKEHLRRRVWNEKDIYLVSADERVHIPRGDWRQIRIAPKSVQSTRHLPRAPYNPFSKPAYFSQSYPSNKATKGEWSQHVAES